MRFALSAEHRDFATSLRESLAKADVPAALRSGEWRPVWNRLVETGVTALGIPEPLGGIGADALDLVVAFEELGRAAVPGPTVESLAVLPVLLAGTPDEGRLAAVATGELVASLAAPPDVPYALDGAVADVCYLLDGETLHRAEVGTVHRSVDASRHPVEVTPVERVASGVDAALARDIGALATAAQLAGAGWALLERSTEYARQRTQFGRPIGSFQAVKHHLADVLVALELARPLVYGAALAVRDDASTRTRDVSAAKVACADAAYLAARVALQMHGAIGYTAEYDLALWLTRVRALVTAWGTPAVHRGRVLAALP